MYVGDGSSDVHVMLHVNRLGGLTVAVSENKYLTPIAQRTVLSDDALSVLVPVLEEIVGLDPGAIRALFESHGFVLQEWDKVRTDSLTIREAAAVPTAVSGDERRDRLGRDRRLAASSYFFKRQALLRRIAGARRRAVDLVYGAFIHSMPVVVANLVVAASPSGRRSARRPAQAHPSRPRRGRRRATRPERARHATGPPTRAPRPHATLSADCVERRARRSDRPQAQVDDDA